MLDWQACRHSAAPTADVNDGSVIVSAGGDSLSPIGPRQLVAGILWLIIQIRRKATKVKGYLSSFILIVWGLGWFGASLSWQISYNRSLDNFISLYNNKQFEIVEGIVEVQYCGKKEGHDGGDVIVIANTRFQLSHFTATPAYHESIVYSGVLKEGVNVKVFHNDGDILRIDLRKSATTGGSHRMK